MLIFKNKIFQRVMSPIIILLLLVLIDSGVGELLEPVTYATYFNHDVKDIEDTEEVVDIVFIGASRVYRTFVPDIFEKKLGLNCVVNAGSSSQPICATYYELKDLVERVHPRKVFIGVTWDQLISDNSDRLQGKLIVYDRLSLTNRLIMGVNCFNLSEKRYLMDCYRFKDKFTLDKMKVNWGEHQELINNGYIAYSDDKEYYADTGFVYNYDTYETGTIPITGGGEYSDSKILREDQWYLDECIDLCEKNNIEVALVTGVTSVMRMYATDNYQEAVDFFSNYAQKNNIQYYNLNYLVGREDFLPDELMHDYNHVNGEGAYIVSDLFSDILNEEAEGKDINKFFYNDIDEFKDSVHRVVAVKAIITSDEASDTLYHAVIESLQNEEVEVYYRVLIKYETDDEYSTLIERSSQNELDFCVEKEGAFTIRIEAISDDEDVNKIAWQEYSF